MPVAELLLLLEESGIWRSRYIYNRLSMKDFYGLESAYEVYSRGSLYPKDKIFEAELLLESSGILRSRYKRLSIEDIYE